MRTHFITKIYISLHHIHIYHNLFKLVTIVRGDDKENCTTLITTQGCKQVYSMCPQRIITKLIFSSINVVILIIVIILS